MQNIENFFEKMPQVNFRSAIRLTWNKRIFWRHTSWRSRNCLAILWWVWMLAPESREFPSWFTIGRCKERNRWRLVGESPSECALHLPPSPAILSICFVLVRCVRACVWACCLLPFFRCIAGSFFFRRYLVVSFEKKILVEKRKKKKNVIAFVDEQYWIYGSCVFWFAPSKQVTIFFSTFCIIEWWAGWTCMHVQQLFLYFWIGLHVNAKIGQMENRCFWWQQVLRWEHVRERRQFNGGEPGNVWMTQLECPYRIPSSLAYPSRSLLIWGCGNYHPRHIFQLANSPNGSELANFHLWRSKKILDENSAFLPYLSPLPPFEWGSMSPCIPRILAKLRCTWGYVPKTKFSETDKNWILICDDTFSLSSLLRWTFRLFMNIFSPLANIWRSFARVFKLIIQILIFLSYLYEYNFDLCIWITSFYHFNYCVAIWCKNQSMKEIFSNIWAGFMFSWLCMFQIPF